MSQQNATQKECRSYLKNHGKTVDIIIIFHEFQLGHLFGKPPVISSVLTKVSVILDTLNYCNLCSNYTWCRYHDQTGPILENPPDFL